MFHHQHHRDNRRGTFEFHQNRLRLFVSCLNSLNWLKIQKIQTTTGPTALVKLLEQSSTILMDWRRFSTRNVKLINWEAFTAHFKLFNKLFFHFTVALPFDFYTVELSHGKSYENFLNFFSAKQFFTDFWALYICTECGFYAKDGSGSELII